MRFARDTRSRLMLPDRRLLMAAPQQALLMFGAAAAPANKWNSADKDADVTLSGSDLVATVVNPANGAVRAVTPRDASLNRYFEVTVAGTDINSSAGVATGATSLSGASVAGSYFYNPLTDTYYANGSGGADYMPTESGIVGVLVDFGAATITLKRSGKFHAAAFSSISGTLYPMWGPGTSGAGTRTGTLNTGGSAFTLGLPPVATAWGGTWNNADKSAGVTLSGSDLIASTTATAGGVRGTQGRSSGVYYFEITHSGADSAQLSGVGNSSANISLYPGSDTNGWAYYYQTGQKYTNNTGAAMPAAVTSTTLGVWLNAGDLKVIADGAAGGNLATGLTGNLYPFWSYGSGVAGTRTGTLNVGNSSFVWSLPSGATAWG
jgi:hypothetical protein